MSSSIFTLPTWVKDILTNYDNVDMLSGEQINQLRNGLKKFKVDNPEATIAIPVYNEEKDIVKTLASIARMQPNYPTELLFIDNNSNDRTREILDLFEVKTVHEPIQSISFARQAGLDNARGKYLLNADGDTIYPPGWINAYVEKLKDPKIGCVYGRYSFIPSKGSSRFVLAIYEIVSRFLFNRRRRKMDFFNVLGFNNAFRTEDGRSVGGYNTSRKRWSDGWMAMLLLQGGFGKIELVKDKDVMVWTSDRRIVYDGGLIPAIFKRLKKELKRYFNLVKSQGQLKT